MVDLVDPRTRSRMMASIGPTNTAPEVAVRRYLHAAGLRFRLHDKRLPGRPDIVLPGHRIVIFVHGCFWHRHSGCRYASAPATNVMFWQDKFASNVRRDRAKTELLEQRGWTVLVVWECEAGDVTRLDQLYWTVRARGAVSASLAEMDVAAEVISKQVTGSREIKTSARTAVGGEKVSSARA